MAILQRWGASKNAFKHINNRHPLHYHPGFKLEEDENQELANPEIKEKQNLINQIQKRLNTANEQKRRLPEKVDASSLENYKSFKKIDNEGKNLFDFVTSSIWNVRKQMVDLLRPFFNRQNELVDLFYTITECRGCRGWIKSTKTEVIVRLEQL